MQVAATVTRKARPEEADPSPGEAFAGQITVTDEELVARAQEGDRHAFGQLVRRWQQKMFALALREVQD